MDSEQPKPETRNCDEPHGHQAEQPRLGALLQARSLVAVHSEQLAIDIGETNPGAIS